MGHILKIKPVFKEMIWGGSRLKEIYNYDIPSDKTGECWAISAHKNGDCVIENTEFANMKLSTLYQEHRELFGDNKDEVFPLLVKIIDANNDLSVQVHPDDIYAKANENSLGKTECWYVLGTKDDTKMVMGHHAKNIEELKTCIETNNYDQLLNKFDVHAGDFFYIPSGTIHAICAGSLIYEAQQSSDITYRVYDYNRKDDNGNTRELHVKQSLETITVPHNSKKHETKILHSDDAYSLVEMIKSEYFTVNKLDVHSSCVLEHNQLFSLVSVIEGMGSINEMTVKKGDHLIICNDVNQLNISGEMSLMITTK